MKIKLYNKIAEEGLALFKEEYVVSENVDNYDAILVRSAKLHDEKFPQSLKCIARAGAGVNNIPIEEASKAGIVVFNTPGANANAVKELVIAGLLMASRKITQGIEWVKNVDCEDLGKEVEKGKSAFVGPEIAGKKLGVIGLGAIGVQVANVASALGMEVYGYDPYISVQAAWTLKARINHAKDVKMIYENCDYITIHIPYMDDTKNFINSEAIAMMKKDVKIINFARGGLVDDEAIIKAMNSGDVAAYVTDFPNKAILECPQTIAIPHLGASTPESEENCAIMAVKECKDYLEYGTIKNSINFPEYDMAKEGSNRICILNHNVPNVVGCITSLLASNKINIENMFNKAKKDYAYTVVETNDTISDAILKSIAENEGIISVRLI